MWPFKRVGIFAAGGVSLAVRVIQTGGEMLHQQKDMAFGPYERERAVRMPAVQVSYRCLRSRARAASVNLFADTPHEVRLSSL
jgi:hypothetical protein